MITILLSTYNGARFLPEQLASFERQTNSQWHLVWRDDGSTDDTVSIMEWFSTRTNRCTRIKNPTTRLGPTDSFLFLLREVSKNTRKGDVILFSDQDDIWMPEKIERARERLIPYEDGVPALYFARQKLIDENENIIGDSPKIKFLPTFPDCLTQNIAAGCTIALNYKATIAVNKMKPPRITYHDWWCYIVVSSCGGVCIYDDRPVIYYRQHQNNAIGAQKNFVMRAVSVFRRGPSGFMEVFREQIEALTLNSSMMASESKNFVELLKEKNSIKYKLFLFVLQNKLRRQGFIETMLFYVWVLLG